MLLRRFRCEFAVYDNLPGCRGEADIGLHLRQQARGDVVSGHPAPVNILALHGVIRVDAIKGADKLLEQDRHLPLVTNELHELAAAGLFGNQTVAMDQLANLKQDNIF